MIAASGHEPLAGFVARGVLPPSRPPDVGPPTGAGCVSAIRRPLIRGSARRDVCVAEVVEDATVSTAVVAVVAAAGLGAGAAGRGGGATVCAPTVLVTSVLVVDEVVAAAAGVLADDDLLTGRLVRCRALVDTSVRT
jgi:hypothetical protein